MSTKVIDVAKKVIDMAKKGIDMSEFRRMITPRVIYDGRTVFARDSAHTRFLRTYFWKLESTGMKRELAIGDSRDRTSRLTNVTY